jgi:pimeloyl-ACP methyl ester carboxylesterase
VILIPGSFSPYRAFNRIIPLLADRYRLLAVDYVGTGESGKPTGGFGYTVEEQADLIAEMIEKLGLGRAHLVGSSYGGAIVLYLAAFHPHLVNKVVSIEGGVVRPENLRGDPMEFLLKYPVLGDLFVAVSKTGLLNRVFMRLIAGAWYPRMTPDDKREMLEQLH